MLTRISDDGKYLISKSEGPITIEFALRMMEEYVKLVEETGITRILSDVRGTPSVMNVSKIYEFAYQDTRRLGFPRGVRAAILSDPEDDSHDFAETVARNAGYQVKVFHTEESALAWLLGDEASERSG